MLIGSLVLTLSYVASAFVESINLLIVVLGIVGGRILAPYNRTVTVLNLLQPGMLFIDRCQAG